MWGGTMRRATAEARMLDLGLVEEVADFDDLVLVDTGPAVLISYGSGFLLLSDTSLGSVEDTDFVFA
jgi:hypothetical protein